ncbi:MAG TPA: NUDIX domain-containing protein [Chloroflexota bacterium]|nr:NUDIX domain-containing protein [Chloroflexota bacterium]
MPAAPAADDSLTVKRKGFAYVTHGAPGRERLLIFSHPEAPEAGLQVPAGTLEEGEPPDLGALREAHEETGLAELELVGFLGERRRDMREYGRAELHHRYFFHVRCTAETPPERWQNYEVYPSDQLAAGEVTERPLFELFWVPLPDGVPELVAGHDALLPMLMERLGLRGRGDGAERGRG